MKCTRIDSTCHVNWNSIIYRKGAVHATKIDLSILAAKRFNPNLVHFLLLNHYYYMSLLLVTCMLSTLQAWFPMCMDVQQKRFCVHEICVQKIIIYEGLRPRYFTLLIISTPIYPKIEVFSYICPRFWSE